MTLRTLPISWVDLLALIVVLLGLRAGRKRGMSEELLDVLKWLAVLVAAAFLYQPIGEFFAQLTPFSLLAWYVVTYGAVILIVQFTFTVVRHRVGDKIVGSDTFGKAEYYLGMAAGAFRYACILLVCMAFINARYYTPEERRAEAAFQEHNFGAIRFPTLNSIQEEVFEQSVIGLVARDYLSVLLIRPTSPQDKQLEPSTLIRAREREVYEVLEKK